MKYKTLKQIMEQYIHAEYYSKNALTFLLLQILLFPSLSQISLSQMNCLSGASWGSHGHGKCVYALIYKTNLIYFSFAGPVISADLSHLNFFL